MSGIAAPRPGEDGEAVAVEIGPYRLAVATSFGPRVLDLRLGDAPSMFARLGDDTVIDLPDSGVYRFHGGHRLWASPEVPDVTYAPDDMPCQVDFGPERVSITGSVDRAGLIKRIVVERDGDRLVVDHTLGNPGPDVIEAGPWAITQLRLGGAVVLPTTGPVPEGLQASHSLVLWPYTDLSDSRITWRRRALVISAMAGPPFKIGAGPGPRRLGYLLDGHLFTKELPGTGEGEYADRGAVGQVYLNQAFCELESVGPIITLEPGSTASHRELWSIEPCAGPDDAYRQVAGEPL
ncbi:MAG: hypothetical protein ACRDZM_09100 [Acidimicrobiia bacterium]